MPSRLHELCLAKAEDIVWNAIQKSAWLMHRQGSKDMASQLGKIYKGRSATIELSALGAVSAIRKRNPDATFYHPSQPLLPRLVIEVSYSQRASELQKLATSYIKDSHGSIGCVVGFSLPYPLPKKHTRHVKQLSNSVRVSVWRGSVGRNGIEITRAENPLASGVELYISDLLPASFATHDNTDLYRDSSLEISLARFAAFLHKELPRRIKTTDKMNAGSTSSAVSKTKGELKRYSSKAGYVPFDGRHCLRPPLKAFPAFFFFLFTASALSFVGP